MEAREKQPIPSLHFIPDVRHMPLADRRAVFLDGLRALSQMTGVYVRGAAAAPGALNVDDVPLDYRAPDEWGVFEVRRQR